MGVVLISSAMLFLGLVGVAFGIMRRLRKRSQGIPENVKERPKDSGRYIRCPKCGCPIGESRSVKSWASADSDASEKSTHTKASSNSNRTNSPSRTRCPACRYDLTRLDGSYTTGSQQSSEFDVSDSCAFKPGGCFLDLEQGSNGMGDCESPGHDATRATPKSALSVIDENQVVEIVDIDDNVDIEDSQPARQTGTD